MLRTAAEEVSISEKGEAAKKQVDKWRETAARYQNEPDTNEGRDQLAARAKAAEKKRDRSMDSYHNFESAAAAAQIAIVLASASIIAEIAALVWIASALGVIGIFFCVMGTFFPFALHIF